MIDTRNYGWNETEIRVAGMLLISVEGVAWNEKVEKEAIYGKGSDPLAIKRGNRMLDGTLSLLQDALERLLDLSPGGKITDLTDVDIQVAFVNEVGRMVRYTLVGIEFTEEPHSINQNDKVGKSQLPFIFLSSRRVA